MRLDITSYNGVKDIRNSINCVCTTNYYGTVKLLPIAFKSNRIVFVSVFFNNSNHIKRDNIIFEYQLYECKCVTADTNIKTSTKLVLDQHIKNGIISYGMSQFNGYNFVSITPNFKLLKRSVSDLSHNGIYIGNHPLIKNTNSLLSNLLKYVPIRFRKGINNRSLELEVIRYSKMIQNMNIVVDPFRIFDKNIK